MKITNLKDASSVSGGKASGLALLNKMGVPVPAGFVIDDTLNLEFNEANILEIQKFLSQLDSTKNLLSDHRHAQKMVLVNHLLVYLKLN